MEDADGNNLFEGGFLGLDNIGPIDRSHLPVGGTLEQSDATGWMAYYALAMAAIAIVLNWSGQRPATDLVLKFLEHFAAITRRHRQPGAVGRRRTGSSTTGCSPRTAPRSRSRSGRWSGSSRCWRPPWSTRRCSTGRSRSASSSPDYVDAPWPGRPRQAPGDRPDAGRPGPAAAAAQRGRHRPPGEAVHQAVRRARVPVPVRAARALGLPPRPSLRAGRGRRSAPPSTTSRPSRPRTCSAGTPTGGGRSGSRSTT